MFKIFLKIDKCLTNRYGDRKIEAAAAISCIWLLIIIGIFAIAIMCALDGQNIIERVFILAICLSAAVPIGAIMVIGKLSNKE